LAQAISAEGKFCLAFIEACAYVGAASATAKVSVIGRGRRYPFFPDRLASHQNG